MKNLKKLYGFRRFKSVSLSGDYSFLVLLLRRFGCLGVSRDCVDADQAGRAGDNWKGQLFISGNDDGFPKRSGNQRRDSVFLNIVAKNTIIGVAVFISFIVSVLFAFFSVMFVLG